MRQHPGTTPFAMNTSSAAALPAAATPAAAPAPIPTLEPERIPSPLLLVTSALIGAFAFLHVYSVQAILAILLQDFHATVVQVGNTVGVTVLAVALTAPLMGMISDAWGRKPLIVGSVLFLALPTMAIFWVRDIHTMLVLRFLQGLAVPGITVVILAYIGEEFRGRNMARMVSMYVSGTVLGGFLGRFLIGHLSEHMHWQTAFLFMGLVNLAGAVLVWRILPPSRHFVANPRFADGLHTLRMHVANPAVLTACALGFCVLFTLVGGFTYINLHLADAPYMLSSGQLADIFAVYLLGVVVTPVTSRLLPRFGFRTTILLAMGMSLAGLCLTLLPFTPGIIVALAIMSTGIFITQSSTISFIAHRVSEGRSLASGLYYMAYYCGGFTGAWLCGIAYTHGRWHGTVALLCAVVCTALLIVRRWMPTKV